MMNYCYILAVFMVMFMFSGCSDPYIEVQIDHTLAVPAVDKRIVYGTDFLRLTLPVTNIASTRLNDDRQKVQVRVQNVCDATMVAAYKFEWFDQNGIVAPESGWRQKVIPQKGSEILVSSAPSVSYNKFKLTLRSAQLVRIIEDE